MAYEVLETCMLVPGISTANCSGWVQAWGSLVGLAVAIAVPWRIRMSEMAHHKKAELAAASVVASGLSLKLLKLIAAIRGAEAFFNLPGQPLNVAAGRQLLTTLNPMGMPNDSELLLLVHTLPKCISRLSKGRNQYGAALFSVEVNTKPYASDSDLIPDALGHYRSLTLSAVENFEVALAELKDFMNKPSA